MKTLAETLKDDATVRQYSQLSDALDRIAQAVSPEGFLPHAIQVSRNERGEIYVSFRHKLMFRP
jgi:hypothetical protein